MRIAFDGSLVTMTPETEDEKAKASTLWQLLIDCNGFAKKLTPVGEYAPLKHKTALTFQIEDFAAKGPVTTEVRVQSDCKAYCKTCNNLIDLKAGDVLPLCCGHLMDILD